MPDRPAGRRAGRGITVETVFTAEDWFAAEDRYAYSGV
jgi:hypothetical protein